MSGIVHLVGAGPGDPELLTLRARRLLDAADVVVHDRLIASALLDTIPPGIRLVAVGKAGGGVSTPQDEIHALLIRLARDGANVVRLKGRDRVRDRARRVGRLRRTGGRRHPRDASRGRPKRRVRDR